MEFVGKCRRSGNYLALDIKQEGADVSGSMSSEHGSGTLENVKVSGKSLKE